MEKHFKMCLLSLVRFFMLIEIACQKCLSNLINHHIPFFDLLTVSTVQELNQLNQKLELHKTQDQDLKIRINLHNYTHTSYTHAEHFTFSVRVNTASYL